VRKAVKINELSETIYLVERRKDKKLKFGHG